MNLTGFTKMPCENWKYQSFLELDDKGDIWKRFRSDCYNYDFRLSDGLFLRWGEKEEDDPGMSPFGPEILDCEITDICRGVDGKLCPYCYKGNNPIGKNMSFEIFKGIIEKVNFSKQLTQVAFGLGSTANENPDLWKMCEYLREESIIPNGTVAHLDDDTAKRIAYNFGGCAVSFHGSFEVLAETVRRLTSHRDDPLNKLAQVNIHFMICEETFGDCLELLDRIKSCGADMRFEKLNAVVLLGLKQCGRAEKGFTKLSEDKFKRLVGTALSRGIGLGFDSCSANKFINVVTQMTNEKIAYLKAPVGKEAALRIKELFLRKQLKKYVQMAEPCESGLFSAYVNVKGHYHHCSFTEQHPEYKGSVLDLTFFTGFKNFWGGSYGEMGSWREMLRKSNRSCPIYDV